MAKLLVLYRKPQDAARFRKYYEEVHIPLGRKISQIRKFEVSTGPIMTVQGESDYILSATLTFDSMTDLQAAMASPEGMAAGADLANFADGGAEMLIFEDRAV
jgi:uncharacterized protein (TIGR02118 family)